MQDRKKDILRCLKNCAFQEAIDRCQSYLDWEDDDPKIFFYWAYALSELQRPEEALQTYQKALKCPQSESIRSEVTLGIAKILFNAKSHFTKSLSDQQEEEAYITAAIQIYQSQQKEAQYKEYLFYLLEIHEHTNYEKYIAVAETHLNLHQVPNSSKLDITRPEIEDILFRYLKQSLLHANASIRSLVEEGVFSQSREAIIIQLSTIFAKQNKSNDYQALLRTTPTGNQRFLTDLFDSYLRYLQMQAYAKPVELTTLLDLLNQALTDQISLQPYLALLKLLASDFLDLPGLLGTLADYKGYTYNTLSPTIFMLRFPTKRAQVATIYQSYEALGLKAYPLKREYISAHLYYDVLKEKLAHDSNYSSANELAHFQQLGISFTHPVSLSLLLDAILPTANFTCLRTILATTSLPTTDTDTNHYIDSLVITPPPPNAISTENILMHLLATTPGLVPVLQSFNLTIELDALHVLMVQAHLCLSQGSFHPAYLILNSQSSRLELLRQQVRLLTDPAFSSTITAKVDTLYAYGKFLVEYNNKIGSTAPPQPNTNPILTRVPLLTTTYQSPYTYQTLNKLHSPAHTQLDLFPFPATNPNPFHRHLIAIHNFENNNRSLAISLLRDLYKHRPLDYFLVSDLSLLLSEAAQAAQARQILDRYLHGRVYRQEEHLLLLSLQLLREVREWQQAEQRAHDLLAILPYHYKIKMALAESLAEQCKYGYADKIVQEIIQTEEQNPSPNQDQVLSAKTFSIYIKIKTGQLDNLTTTIQAVLATIPSPDSKFFQILIKYQKHVYAKELQQTIKAEGMTNTHNLIKNYTNLPATTSITTTTTTNTSTNTTTDSPPAPISALSYTISLIDSYITLLSHHLSSAPLLHPPSLPDPLPVHLKEAEEQQLLITTGKLLFLLARATNRLTNPQIHQNIASYLKRAALFGETKEALEIEYILRIFRGEDVSTFYQGERISEESPFSRTVHSLIYRPSTIATNTREYLKHSTLASAPFLILIARTLISQKDQPLYEDLENVFLHLSRRYLPNDPIVSDVFNYLKNQK
ncbi:hypothetical protein NEHOM01_0069 [Nematocida homosporus]|uniref:uncharacterized protein n=1 Tax=Nematocida homosporus TaxID=1912981 RepID=UPI0022208F61|nr:uncharacterized protein NEHOM01_0069 [Nematocida homosporus]KAI5184324.1 hypothetical protein NEHOM01_0069 [Nematocida homosporus]